MNNITFPKDQIEEAEKSNVLSFSIPKPDRKPPQGGNWLITLPVGTVFVAKAINSPSPEATEFEIRTKLNNSVYLSVPQHLEIENHSSGKETEEQVVKYSFVWVDPAKFSQAQELLDLVYIPEED